MGTILSCAGEPLGLAYVRAGYKEGYSARYNASRLRNVPEVRSRINEIQEASAEHSAISADYVRHRLLGLMEVDPVDLYERDPDRPGKLRLRPMESLPESVRKSVTRLKVDPLTGKPTEYVLADKTQAASALLRSLPGGSGPSVVVNASASAQAGAEVSNMSNAEVARRISWIIEEAALETGETIDVSPAPAPIDQAQPRAPAALAPPKERARAMAMSAIDLAQQIRAAGDRDAMQFLHSSLEKVVKVIAQEMAKVIAKEVPMSGDEAAWQEWLSESGTRPMAAGAEDSALKLVDRFKRSCNRETLIDVCTGEFFRLVAGKVVRADGAKAAEDEYRARGYHVRSEKPTTSLRA